MVKSSKIVQPQQGCYVTILTFKTVDHFTYSTRKRIHTWSGCCLNMLCSISS